MERVRRESEIRSKQLKQINQWVGPAGVWGNVRLSYKWTGPEPWASEPGRQDRSLGSAVTLSPHRVWGHVASLVLSSAPATSSSLRSLGSSVHLGRQDCSVWHLRLPVSPSAPSRSPLRGLVWECPVPKSKNLLCQVTNGQGGGS